MWNEEFPRSILLTMLQSKMNIGSNIDLHEAVDITPPTDHGTEGGNSVPNHTDNLIYRTVTPKCNLTQDITDLLEND